MGIGFSIFLIAIGAVLVWAVNLTVGGIELVTVGWILLALGALGLLLSLIVAATAGRSRDEEVVVRDRY
ncbi:MAG TPA: DUF6458 family protein [Gaiellaceae bacterium]|nr:DUF6458 family protein [Gaiellaceae bacterium]